MVESDTGTQWKDALSWNFLSLCVLLPGDASEAGHPLSQLPNMVLSETHISHIDELFALQQRCPGLRELRLLEVPLTSSWPEEVRRELVIAVLPQLTTLNGSKISEEDMEKAERAFVRHHRYSDDMPRKLRELFDRLVEKHGLLEPLRDIRLGPSRELISVTVFWFETTVNAPTRGPVCVKVSLSTSFASFKVLVAQALGADPRVAQSLRVFRQDRHYESWSQIYCPPDRDLYMLYFQDNTEIRVCDPVVSRRYR